MVSAMTSSRRFNRRWAAPAVALVAIAAFSVAPNVIGSAGATPADLPLLTPAQLLVKARTAQVTALSGTVELTSNLGLPSLDSLGALGGGGSDTSIASLLSGTHSAQVWMQGADHVRVATQAPLEETNWIRNGADLWSYDSSTLTATHATMPADTTDTTDTAGHPATKDAGSTPTSSDPDPAYDTPVQYAQALLDKVDPSTTVGIDTSQYVAGHAAYELVLTPKAADSTIGQVTLAIDAATGLALDVKVTAKSSGTTAFEIGFTKLSYTAPAASTFDFTPPPGAKVVQAKDPSGLLGAGGRFFGEGRHAEVKPPQTASGAPAAPAPPDTGGSGQPADTSGSGNHITTVGPDWTTAAIISGASIPAEVRPLLAGAPAVTVGSTSGRVITTTLFTVLVLDDGRVAIGAVTPAALEALVAGAPG
jgi:outer membrane lipoprotein-sorting protein